MAVHPRLRGELKFLASHQENSVGSSPLTRGTPDVALSLAHADRFIPAYAGNSQPEYACHHSQPVHPRLRGELLR